MNNSRPTQCDRILKYISECGSITTREAVIELGICSFRRRIAELRAKGVPILDKPETVKNRYGETCYIKRYYLDKKDA